MSASKERDGKPDLSLVPYCAQVAIAEALMYGEKKYARFDYCKGHKISDLIAAAMRHIGQFNDGEDCAPDSGLSHLAHAMANLAMLIHQAELGTSQDDRYTATQQILFERHWPYEEPAGIDADARWVWANASIGERSFEIRARDNRGEEVLLERCPDITLAQSRLDHYRNEWPTFKLGIEEVCDGHSEID